MSSQPLLDRYKLVFFTPAEDLPSIKSVIFATGAGRYPGKGGYSECCSTNPVTGQFRPGPDARPAIGTPGVLEEVEEMRCEILCLSKDVTLEAIKALKRSVGG